MPGQRQGPGSGPRQGPTPTRHGGPTPPPRHGGPTPPRGHRSGPRRPPRWRGKRGCMIPIAFFIILSGVTTAVVLLVV